MGRDRLDCSRYFISLEHEKASGTVEAYTYTLLKFLRFLDGRKPSQKLADEFLEDFRKKGNQPRSIVRHIVALRHFFKWLKISYEPEKLHLKKTLPPYITEEEFDLLVSRAWHPKLKAALALLFGAGLRLSEASNLGVGDVKVDGYVRVIGKGDKERIVPVEDEILKMIEPWRSTLIKMGSKWLFPGRTFIKPQVKSGFQAMIKNHMKRCGIKGKRVHSFRHGAATSLYNRGTDLRHLQEFLGHENIATTSLYTHLAPGRLREDILKAGRFREVVKG